MKFYKLLPVLFLAALFSSCEDYLERLPKDQLVEDTAFESYSNFQTYAWSFYNTFTGYSNLGTFVNKEFDTDMGSSSNNYNGSSWLWDRVTVPSSSSTYTNCFSNIRTINIMLQNIDDSPLSDEEKNHWRAVGYFFRANEYFSLVNRYGDIHIVDRVLTDGDSKLYEKQDPREEVTAWMLEDLLYAEEHIDGSKDGDNAIDVHVVRALISRFGLFEGTWRKYHGGFDDADVYLQASFDASSKLIADHPTLHSKYDEMFNSEDLALVDGVLLYKLYQTGVYTHQLASRHRNSSGNWDLTRAAVDMYLCSDGKPVSTSEQFGGYKDKYAEFRNRDYRLYHTTVAPYSVVNSGNNREFEYSEDPEDREFIDLIAQICEPTRTLPDVNWQGFVVRTIPHYRDDNDGQGYNVTRSGYKLHKYFNTINMVQNVDINDAPLFRMGEILANHAEASFELGTFDQSVADITINLLRERGNVAPMTVGLIDAAWDTNRDPAIDPVLWEIRRERAVELMYEGFRWNDLRRWKKMGDYAAQVKLGRWENNNDHNGRLKIQDDAEEGFIQTIQHGLTPPAFPEHYYLYPIPSDQIVLNPNLEQNPGWATN